MTIKNYVQILNESKTKYFILFDKYSLWFTYSPGSGNAIPLKFNDLPTYITDKVGDTNFDKRGILKDIIKSTKNLTPIKNKDNISLYPLPIYKNINNENLDIWGGNESPSKINYFVLSTGKINVVTFFDSKKEALSWIKYS